MIPTNIFYRRNLPHIHPEGSPLFITFRLADSLPIEVIRVLQRQKDQERKTLKNYSPEKIYEIEKKHFSWYDDWLDRCASGPQWLADETIAGIISEKFHFMKGEHFQLLAYCIMPNHVHLLIESIITDTLHHRGKAAKYPVTDALRLLKGNTAQACNLKLERNGQFWNQESYDHYARDERELESIIKYILNNPVKAGLVKEWTDWGFAYVNPELGSW